MNHEPQTLERELAALAPSRVPARLLERIEAGIAALPDPAAAKVVPFPAPNRPAAPVAARRPAWLAAAAAVALVGAVAAFLAPPQRQTATAARQAPAFVPAPVPALERTASSAPERKSAAPGGFVPTDSRAGVRDVRDEGLLWTPDHQPLRRVRVEYYQRFTLVNGRGERLEVERPRVEYFLLPLKMH